MRIPNTDSTPPPNTNEAPAGIRDGWLADDLKRASERVASGFSDLVWRPIGQAKRDGTEYIGWLGPKKFRLIWFFAPSSRTAGWCDESGKRVHPTYFMPKPADPR